jgi:hypothetical protein
MQMKRRTSFEFAATEAAISGIEGAANTSKKQAAPDFPRNIARLSFRWVSAAANWCFCRFLGAQNVGVDGGKTR